MYIYPSNRAHPAQKCPESSNGFIMFYTKKWQGDIKRLDILVEVMPNILQKCTFNPLTKLTLHKLAVVRVSGS